MSRQRAADPRSPERAAKRQRGAAESDEYDGADEHSQIWHCAANAAIARVHGRWFGTREAPAAVYGELERAAWASVGERARQALGSAERAQLPCTSTDADLLQRLPAAAALEPGSRDRLRAQLESHDAYARWAVGLARAHAAEATAEASALRAALADAQHALAVATARADADARELGLRADLHRQVAADLAHARALLLRARGVMPGGGGEEGGGGSGVLLQRALEPSGLVGPPGAGARGDGVGGGRRSDYSGGAGAGGGGRGGGCEGGGGGGGGAGGSLECAPLRNGTGSLPHTDSDAQRTPPSAQPPPPGARVAACLDAAPPPAARWAPRLEALSAVRLPGLTSLFGHAVDALPPPLGLCRNAANANAAASAAAAPRAPPCARFLSPDTLGAGETDVSEAWTAPAFSDAFAAPDFSTAWTAPDFSDAFAAPDFSAAWTAPDSLVPAPDVWRAAARRSPPPVAPPPAAPPPVASLADAAVDGLAPMRPPPPRDGRAALATHAGRRDGGREARLEPQPQQQQQQQPPQARAAARADGGWESSHGSAGRAAPRPTGARVHFASLGSSGGGRARSAAASPLLALGAGGGMTALTLADDYY